MTFQICFDPYKLNELCKFEYDELKTLIVDNFTSMVRAGKLSLGEISDYMVVEDAIHMSNGESFDVCTNLRDSASIYLPWTRTVAVTITWNLRYLSKYFAIFPMTCEQMGNNILYNVSWSLCQEEVFFDLTFDRLSLTKVKNEASKHQLFDRFDVHTKNLRLLDSIYGLGSIDYICLKVLGCHHCFYENDDFKAFGLNVGGFFFPPFSNDNEKHGFQFESESESSTSEDEDFLKKTVRKYKRSKYSVFVSIFLIAAQ